MKRILLCALTAVAVSVSSFALTAGVAAGDQSAEAAHEERMQHWAADHETMMDARLGGMKAALKLTPEQNPLWEAFEDAVRGGAKSRMDDMREMMENRNRMSSVERMDATAGRMARRADELKRSPGEAAKPLYGSDLDDTQKHKFELVGDEMMMAAKWANAGSNATILVTSMTPRQKTRWSAIYPEPQDRPIGRYPD